MCIIFAYVNNEPKPDEYQIIIANNRDEYYERPTKAADFWENSPECISGIDLDPRRGGGTWFGVSTHGKIGALLNVLDSDVPDREKKGRGYLVNNYLASDINGGDYIEQLKKDKQLYNKFNLITIQKSDGVWRTDFLGTEDDDSPKRLDSETFAVGNSSYNSPWRKVGYGHEKFKRLVAEYGNKNHQDQFVSGLVALLKDETRHFPDKQLELQGTRLSDVAIRERSAICVITPSMKYGTRTHTLLLVDAEDNVTYIEHTMREPIDEYNPEWDVVQHKFVLSEVI